MQLEENQPLPVGVPFPQRPTNHQAQKKSTTQKCRVLHLRRVEIRTQPVASLAQPRPKENRLARGESGLVGGDTMREMCNTGTEERYTRRGEIGEGISRF